MHSLSHFFRDERGSQTIEFVLWVPIIGALMVLVTDAFNIYMTHTEMWNVARDTARRMTMGDITSKADAETYASSQLSLFDYPYSVAAIHDPDTSMTVRVALNVGDSSFFGLTLFGGTMNARVVMRSEPGILFAAAPPGGGGGSK
jgi:Flp pilus assembly protein TadG